MSAPAQSAVPASPRATWGDRVFSLPVVLGLFLVYLLLLLSAAGSVVRTLADDDIWWHLRNASQLIQTHHFIRADSWTFTVAGQPWVNPEWLGELPFYLAHQWLGERGLYLLTMVLASSIIIGVYWLGWLRSRSWNAAFLTTVAAILFASVSIAPRILLFGWLFLVVELAILWSLHEGRDFTWFLPPLFCVWVNAHGSWFIGFVLMLVFFACSWITGEWGSLYAIRWTPQRARKLTAVTGLSAAALFLNPYGWRLVVYPLNAILHHQLGTESIAEWASLDFHTVRGKFVLAVLLLFLIAQLVRQRRWSIQDLAFAIVAIYAAFAYIRFLFLAGIILMPLFARALHNGETQDPTPPRRPARGDRLLWAIVMAALVAVMTLKYPGATKIHSGIAEAFPERAVPYVRSLAGQGNLFNTFDWGGYLEWQAPQVKEFIDPRVDVFVQHGVMADYIRAVHVEDTYAVLDKYQIRYALLKAHTPMACLLGHSTGWKRSYDDGQAVVFERTH